MDAEDARTRRERVRSRSRELWGQARPVPFEATEPNFKEPVETRQPTKGAAPIVAEREVAEASAKAKTAPRPKSPLPGQGGPEHTYLQSLITQWAQARGFRVEIEKEIAGGRVDVALSREGRKIAVEISVATGGEHEVENINKCLRAGYDPVILVSMKKRFLARLKTLIGERLSAEDSSRVQVLTPEALAAWLLEEPVAEGLVAGYKVKTRYGTGSGGDEDNRRRRLAEVVARSLKSIGEKNR